MTHRDSRALEQIYVDAIHLMKTGAADGGPSSPVPPEISSQKGHRAEFPFGTRELTLQCYSSTELAGGICSCMGICRGQESLSAIPDALFATKSGYCAFVSIDPWF